MSEGQDRGLRSTGQEVRQREILQLARELGLDFFEIAFEVVPAEVMHEMAAYGLPIRANHWSYGKVYNRQRIHGNMGLSRIYEIVLNNDPSYAFLLDTNREIENLLVTAHVAAHADFFKNNALFSGTSRRMVNEAAEHAQLIDAFKEKYGLERVERLMDAAFSIDRHIDPWKGTRRRPYPEPQVVERRRIEQAYSDLFPEEQGYSIERVRRFDHLPPQPERDLLWFLSQYAPLEDWERQVLHVIWRESHYFYPQFMTKILNEGWATYWHAEVIHQYAGINPEEMLEFSRVHAGVVRPGGRFQINPYHLGYRILCDVEKRWDRLYAEGKSPIAGRQKLFQIRSEEDDVSLIRNYLTAELCEELELYVYGPECKRHRIPQDDCSSCQEWVIQSRDPAEVQEHLLRPRYHYGAPNVVIDEVKDGVLHLVQLDRAERGLDRPYAEQTLRYLHELWKGPVRILTCGEDGKEMELYCDRSGVGQQKVG